MGSSLWGSNEGIFHFCQLHLHLLSHITNTILNLDHDSQFQSTNLHRIVFSFIIRSEIYHHPSFRQKLPFVGRLKSHQNTAHCLQYSAFSYGTRADLAADRFIVKGFPSAVVILSNMEMILSYGVWYMALDKKALNICLDHLAFMLWSLWYFCRSDLVQKNLYVEKIMIYSSGHMFHDEKP